MTRLAKWGLLPIAAAALLAWSGAAEACPTGRVCSPGKPCPPESNCVVPGNPLGQPGTSGDHLGLSADPRSTTTVGDTTVGEPQDGAVKPPESELERIKRMPDGLLKEALLRKLRADAKKKVEEADKRSARFHEYERDMQELLDRMRQRRDLRQIAPRLDDPDKRSEAAARMLGQQLEIDRLRAKLGLKEGEGQTADAVEELRDEAKQRTDRADQRLQEARDQLRAVDEAFRPTPTPVPGQTGVPLDSEEVILNGPPQPPPVRP